MIIIKFLILAVFIIATAFFSATETAITSLSTITLRNIKEKYPNLKYFFEFWEMRPNELMSTLLFVNCLALIGTSVIATSLALDFADKTSFPQKYVLVGFPLLIMLILLFFGEIIPKISARYMSATFSVRCLPVLVRINNMMNPLNRFLLRLAEKIIGILGRKTLKEDPFLRPEELKFLLSSKETFPLPDTQRKIMRNILDLRKSRIAQIMVPKSEILAVDLNQPMEKVIEQIIEKEYSRVPVYRGNIDNIAGIIYSRDLALPWRNGSLFVMDDLLRPAVFIPDSAHVDKVLADFKVSHNHMGIVVDEYGSTVGLVTIEDLLEEIVGEIYDEYDIQEKRILAMPDGAYLIKGAESLSYINKELKLNLPASDFATVNGWVLDLYGKIPKAGDVIRWDNLSVEIVDADKKKVNRVRIKKLT